MSDLLRFVHLHPQPVRSKISGRELLVNPSWSHVAVTPTVNPAALRSAEVDYEALIALEDEAGHRIRKSRAETMRRSYQKRYADDGRAKGVANPNKGKPRFQKLLDEAPPGAGLAYMGIRDQTIANSRALFDSPDRGSFALALDAYLHHRALAVDGSRKAAFIRVTNRGDDPKQPMMLSGTPFEDVSIKVHPGLPAHLTEVLAILWAHGLVALPTSGIWTVDAFLTYRGFPRLMSLLYGAALPGIESLRDAIPTKGSTVSRGRFFPALFLSTIGALDAGDFDDEVMLALAGELPEEMKRSEFMQGVGGGLDALRIDQVNRYGNGPSAEYITPSFRPLLVRYEAPRSDPSFGWAVTAGGERVGKWVERCTEYLGDKTLRLTLKADVPPLNHLLDWVIGDPGIPGDPLAVCADARKHTSKLAAYFSNQKMGDGTRGNNMRRVASFFEWLLDSYGVDEDGFRVPGYRNPLPEHYIPATPGRGAKTERHAMPLRYMRLVREIIEENDFAWPRTIKADYLNWRNPETGEFERVWSPVRACMYLLRLILPIRETQVRMLDSGEGDPMVFRRGQWKENSGRLVSDRSLTGSVQGFVRRIMDEDGRTINGLFINTNKTADRSTAYTDPGYEIPWENPEVLALFEYVRDWQERYNPCTRGLTRAELTDSRTLVSEDVAARLPKLHFLFRDAAYMRAPLEPPSAARMDGFWKMLLEELERRLDMQGVRMPDGSPVQMVITRDAAGRVSSVRYDAHSLRVSGLSALAQAGVPIQVLSQLAGHSTIVMTLYYVKVSAGEVSRELDEATIRMQELEQLDWEQRLMSGLPDSVHDMAWYASDAAKVQMGPENAASWETMEEGVCPNGATRCGDGGPLVVLKGRTEHHGPVPGGPRNCALCRFFVTGPAFLGGLVARFNSLTAQVRDAVHALRDAETARREIIGQREGRAAELQYQRAVRHADRRVDTATEALDVLTQSWTAVMTLIKRVHASMQDESDVPPDRPNRLVLNGTVGDLKIQIQSASPFALWDRICQESVFYPSSETRLPSIRRAKVLDAVLGRDGHPAVFATLTEDEALRVGNAVTSLLRTRLGDAGLEELVSAGSRLRNLGVEDEVMALIGQARPVVLGDLEEPALPGNRRALPTAVSSDG